MADTRAIVPAAMQGRGRDDWKMSPAIASGGFVFLTGMTGRDADATVPSDLEAQMVSAFEKVLLILEEAGCDASDIVEMTTYHKNLEDNIELIKDVRARYVAEPWPAWTAIGVSGFTHPDTLFEVRVIAKLKETT